MQVITVPADTGGNTTRTITVPVQVKKTPKETTIPQQPVTQKKIVPKQEWNTSGNFLTENGLTGIVAGLNQNETTALQTSTAKPGSINPVPRKESNYDWLLGIFLLLVLLFVWIRVFYNKFFAALASALSSFQLSMKLFQERNILHQRVSIVLDFIYIVVFSVFLFEYIEYTGDSRTGMSGFKLFLLLLNIVMLYTIFRGMVLRMTGALFMVRPLFSEYLHNTFVVNKSMGILLFPVIIMAQYMPYKVIPVILVTGIVIFIAGLLLKAFRAYQIIIRRDILIFYLILYLCTLEILPLLLGYKFVTSLIQSN